MEQIKKIEPREDVEAVDFKRFFTLLWRNIFLLVAAALLAAGAAFFVSYIQTPIYSASTQVMVTRTSSQGASIDITQSLNAQQIAQTYVELLQQEWILGKVEERVGGSVKTGQVSVSLANNSTPLIYITAEDANPQRAIQIADMLVQVLIEQNEAIQSGRYTSAEENLNLQISQMEEQIAQAQAQLEQATNSAYESQLTEAQKKIQDTQTSIESIRTEIVKLRSLGSVAQVAALLSVNQGQLTDLQALLDGQLAEYQRMSDDINANPLAQSDPLYVPTVQASMAELGVQINDTRARMEALSREITYLTPLAEKDEQDIALKTDGLLRALRTQQELLTSQQTLLKTYQDAYIALQVAGESNIAPNEVAALEDNLKLYQQIYLSLLNNRETLRLDRIQNMPNVVQANPPVASENPVRPRTTLNTLLGGLAGLILALSVVLLSDFLDTTLKSSEDAERASGLPALGYMLPMAASKESEGPFVTYSPRSPAAEAFRSLRTSLEFIGAGKPIKSLLISSSGAGEGKTIIASNLALIIAQGGKKVVILDADLRRPRLHQELGIPNRVGLSDIFRGKATVESALQAYRDTSLSVITSGGIPPNPAELLASEMMVKILDELTAKFDMVVVDSAPTLVTDSQLIAARVDGVMLVIKVGGTQSDATRASVEQYRRVGARLLGVILNDVTAASNGYGYSKYNYYHYDQERQSASRWSLPLPAWWRGDKKNRKKTDKLS